MAGQWEGTFFSRADRDTKWFKQPVTLLVRVSEAGRFCEIDMRLGPTATARDQFHFSHRLNEQRNRITTIDDPRIGRLNGQGIVTDAFDRPGTGQWRAGFRAKQQDGNSVTFCKWDVKDGELTITRRDDIKATGTTTRLYSELKLRRRENP